ncbi:small heat shock protein [Boletus reticuloceps]|uniref:Small heat shock protein n=1 Tax=Boletus reticuloceps TaxID=495285 RepID=A0A8I2YPP6_9AGAM|nr:small heat shock protein [Boletus reticuloceps]
MSLMCFHYDPLIEFNLPLDIALATRFRPSVSADIGRGGSFCPRMDIHESKETNTVTATFELPGMKPENINIDVHKNRLTVAGEARKSDSNEEGGYTVRERSYSKFSRTLQLPFGTKPDDVGAKMEDGVLTVTFPRTNPEQQAQRITIQ